MLSVGRGILFPSFLDIFAARIFGEVKSYGRVTKDYPSLKFVTCAAAMAHHGLLCPVDFIRLGDVDLSTVPTHHLASLVSRAKKAVMINNITGCDLVTLIDSLKCTGLRIDFMSLGTEETEALVRAMESRLVEVDLEKVETLDIEALAKYSGKGWCFEMKFSYLTSEKFYDDLKTWAIRKNWLLHLTTDEYEDEEKNRRFKKKISLFGNLARFKLSYKNQEPFNGQAVQHR